MSFLSQLRTTQAQDNNHQSLKLCYLLVSEAPHFLMQLRLVLVDTARHGPNDGTPYRIQPRHLRHPPSFLNSQDVALLNQLIQRDLDWQQQSIGSLPTGELSILFNELNATGRAYLVNAQDQWQPLQLADSILVNPIWSLDSAGIYHLFWQTMPGWSIRFLDKRKKRLVVCDMATGQIALARYSLKPEAIEVFHSVQKTLSYREVSAFLNDNEARWRKLHLPLPPPVLTKAFSATVHAVLCFARSKASNSDRLYLKFRYCGTHYCRSVNYGQSAVSLDYWDGSQICRLETDESKEQHYHALLQNQLTNIGTEVLPGEWCFDDAGQWHGLLTELRPMLEQQGFLFVIERGFQHYFIADDQWQLEIKPAEGGSLPVHLTINLGEESLDILTLVKQLKRYNQLAGFDRLDLPDGRMLCLPDNILSGIIDGLGDLIQTSTGRLKIPLGQAYRIENLRQQLPDQTQFSGKLDHLDLATSLYQTPQLLTQILEGVNAELRPYQWLGVCWMQHLKRHGFNGILADDMGLGKTLQTLAHLSLEHQQGGLQSPALIVVPTSLLHNWALELERFTPNLRYLIIYGSKRHALWDSLSNYDVLITSYPLIANDLNRWQSINLSWLILDEAHQIKNAKTQVSQALRQLDCDYRLCLTGTPMQNHLGELWSLFDFLIPGCLGGNRQFKTYYQVPIEQLANDERMSQLKERIAPFMLRRTKNQVATDLPPKTEVIQRIDLNADQQAFYQTQKDITQIDLQQQLSESNQAQSQPVLLLTALLKLRQICCDPSLLGETGISSAKRQFCIEMVEELVAEKRSLLVFSQFSSMLELLADDLDRLKIKYLKLTGKTRHRQHLVESFQRGEAPVFLISLKAGGTGLNLTRADTVIHYDPWWNLAAEQQATDRAHRIGQDKPVFVYRLIAADTIEDKIAQLQQHKNQLGQHINHQAQMSGQNFAYKLEDLMALWQQEVKSS